MIELWETFIAWLRSLFVLDPQEPLWLIIARGELGIREIPGDEHNPRILDYHNATKKEHTTDEIPWCSAFICWLFDQVEIPHEGSALARSWSTWGTSLGTPRIGCVCVFERGASPWQGHVGLYVGETEEGIMVLGGNQGNSVSIQEYPKSKLLELRWPDAT